MPVENPPALPARLTRPDAQSVVDALNLRLFTLEKATPEYLRLAASTERKLAFGTFSTAFSAQSSKETSVTHGLGATPLIVLANAKKNSSDIVCSTDLGNETTFTINLRQINDSTITRTVEGYWVAIG